MADDLYDDYDAYEDDIFMDEEEEAVEEPEAGAEGQNRTFIIGISVLGGLLVLAIGILCGFLPGD